MANGSDRRAMLIGAALVLVAAGLALILGRGCRAEPPPPATITPSAPPTSTAVLVTSQTPASGPTSAPVASFTPTAISMPETATNTPTAGITASPTGAASATPVATPVELLGRHRVERGETMYGIGLEWYRGRYFAWGADVWTGICVANPQIVDCRLIYPGDVLGIPRLP